MQSIFAPQLGDTRNIWIYLPPDYQQESKRYPVLYMQDGQNLFDDETSFAGEWHIDETLDSLYNAGNSGCIVVGIENNGARRIAEYTPNAHPKYGGGEGEKYVDFLIKNLKPFIDSTYRTKPEAEFTGIGGSSLGGLISYYAATRHSDTFGKCLVFSPSFWIDSNYVCWCVKSNVDCYLYAGEKEDAGDVVEKCKALKPVWFAGARGSLNFNFAPDGEHSERYWAKAFAHGYLWLFN